MHAITRHTGTLKYVSRLPNSTNGNPRYLCAVDGYTFRTKVDSSMGYAISNYWDKEVAVTLGTHYGLLTLDTLRVI